MVVNMNIYLHELKTYRMNTIIWIFSICGIMMFFMAFFQIIKADMDNYMKFINNFPASVKIIMGFLFEDFSTPIGFHNFAFTYSALLGVIQAMNLGVGIVSKEERERTADFLMTKPVSRVRIINAKLFAVLTIFVITNLCYLFASSFTVLSLSEMKPDMTKLYLVDFSLFMMQIIFFSIGLMVSILMKKVRAVLPVSLGMVFVFYAISAFAVTSKEDKLRYLTPFQYFTSSHIMDFGNYELSFLLTGIGIAVVSIAISYYRYCNKNIQAV
ncbi:MAG: ABC transporter permease subunit [Mobilitalea sp.]